MLSDFPALVRTYLDASISGPLFAFNVGEAKNRADDAALRRCDVAAC